MVWLWLHRSHQRQPACLQGDSERGESTLPGGLKGDIWTGESIHQGDVTL